MAYTIIYSLQENTNTVFVLFLVLQIVFSLFDIVLHFAIDVTPPDLIITVTPHDLLRRLKSPTTDCLVNMLLRLTAK